MDVQIDTKEKENNEEDFFKIDEVGERHEIKRLSASFRPFLSLPTVQSGPNIPRSIISH